MARGKSTTTANHVRDPTGQPKGWLASQWMRAIMHLAPSAPNANNARNRLHNPCKTLMRNELRQVAAGGLAVDIASA
jgi:hypothetical protein